MGYTFSTMNIYIKQWKNYFQEGFHTNEPISFVCHSTLIKCLNGGNKNERINQKTYKK